MLFHKGSLQQYVDSLSFLVDVVAHKRLLIPRAVSFTATMVKDTESSSMIDQEQVPIANIF